MRPTQGGKRPAGEPARSGPATYGRGSQLLERDPAGWWIVRTPSWNLDIPDRCACCMGPAETTTKVIYRVSEEEACGWHFPLCRRCAGHILFRKVALGVVAALAVGAMAGAFMLFDGMEGASLKSVVGVLVAGVMVGAAAYFLIVPLFPGKGPECASVDKPVTVGSLFTTRAEYKDLQDTQCFGFRNEEYAKLFAGMNAGGRGVPDGAEDEWRDVSP